MPTGVRPEQPERFSLVRAPELYGAVDAPLRIEEIETVVLHWLPHAFEAGAQERLSVADA